MTTISLPVSRLELSSFNVRQEVDDASISEMKASILAHGLIAPLVVHTIVATPKAKARYGVLAGGRRLRALQSLIADGALPADHAVDCTIRDEDAATATELSVIENTNRVALSPVEEFAAFAKLAEDPAVDEVAIAQRFGVTVLHVRQRMRLGQLHPTILDDLARGKMTLDVAKAYAATADQDLQLRVYDGLDEWLRRRDSHHVRHQIQRAGSAYDTAMMLRLVGTDAYVAAGGQLEEDLFGGGMRVLQPGTLSELYYAKLDAEKARLAAELGDNVTIQTDSSGIGRYVATGPQLTAEQEDRKRAIDARADQINAWLEEHSEYAEAEDGGQTDRLIAIGGADQAEVDRLEAELDALETETDQIHAAAPIGLPDGPLIAIAEIGAGGLQVRNFYRPADWMPGNNGASGAAPTAAGTSARDPLVPSGIEPGLGYSDDRKGEAKSLYGLTADAIEVMRSHRRAVLRAMMVTVDSAAAVTVAGDYLAFVACRSLLKDPSLGRVRAAHLGIAPGAFGTASGPIVPGAAEEVGAQRAAQEWKTARDALAQEDWMTLPDLAEAFARFTELSREDRARAAAIAGAALLERSLRSPGFIVPVHDQLAYLLGEEGDEAVRDRWIPDEAFFKRLGKKWAVAAVEEVSPKAAKAIGKLPASEVPAACAAFFAVDENAIKRFDMLPGTQAYARRWLPEFLRFEDSPRGRRLIEQVGDGEPIGDRREAA